MYGVPCISAVHDGYKVFAVVDASGTYSKMAQEITLARIVQAGAVPIDTAAVCSEIQKTWNRPDAAQWAEPYSALFPPYQLLIESYSKAQEVVMSPSDLGERLKPFVGAYEAATSPARAPRGINYLLVTLKPGERWTYEPPGGHTVAWVALGEGALSSSERLSNGELVIFEPGEAPSRLRERKAVAQLSPWARQCRIRTSCTWSPTQSTQRRTRSRLANGTSENSRNV